MSVAKRSLRICVLVLLAGGCGGVRNYPVQGKVVWPDGSAAKELAGGMVQFDRLKDDSQVVDSPHGAIREDGSYRLPTGAPEGKYRVLVVPFLWTDGMPGSKPPPILDPRFQQFETAKIGVVVEPRTNEIAIQVERAPKR